MEVLPSDVLLAPSWQDGQPSQSLQAVASHAFARDICASEAQQRRCSLDSCLAQMHQQRISAAGTVSTLLFCNPLCTA
jgi:hypothetical protein